MLFRSISLTSEPGKGSSFEILLPASQERADVEEHHSTGRSLKGLTVLMMDDDEVILRVGQNILQRLGCEPLVARDGEEAARIFKREKELQGTIDLFILDLTIPGASGGKDALLLLRNIDPQVRALISSGYSNDPVMVHYGSHGFNGCIVKPYKIEEMEEALLLALEDNEETG